MRSAILAKTTAIEAMIDSAISDHQDLERQLIITQLCESAAPGPGWRTDQRPSHELERVEESACSDAIEECREHTCHYGYGNGHNGAVHGQDGHDLFTGMFSSYGQEHAEFTTKQTHPPAISHGIMLCPYAQHDSPGQTKSEHSWHRTPLGQSCGESGCTYLQISHRM